MTRVIFDANCLGHSVGDKEDIDDSLAERLIKAGAAHEPDKERIASKASRSKVTKPAEATVTKGD